MSDRTELEGTKQYFKDAIESIVSTRFISGNRVDILKNGDEIFPAMLKAISEAERSLDFLTFIYWQGDIAHKVAEALAEKAKQGAGYGWFWTPWAAAP